MPLSRYVLEAFFFVFQKNGNQLCFKLLDL